MQERDKSSGAAINSCVWRKQVWSQYLYWTQQFKSRMCPGSWMAVVLPPVSPQGYCTFQHVLDPWLRSIGNFLFQNRWNHSRPVWELSGAKVQTVETRFHTSENGPDFLYINICPNLWTSFKHWVYEIHACFVNRFLKSIFGFVTYQQLSFRQGNKSPSSTSKRELLY